MGEVYRARDRRLGREVALKVLPADFADDPIAVQRFEREARAVSLLNHPNICSLHDVGTEAGTYFIVMELLEGRNLRETIGAGPLPFCSILCWGIEIAHAIEAAHAKGIIHRDLKPANIFITSGGVAKLLDFGLARFEKLASPRMPDAETLTATGLTLQGVPVGTANYMSPEQAQGMQVSPTGDLFSFGAVLYEMATSCPAFPGNSVAEIFAAILHTTPIPPSRLRPSLPRQFDFILSRLLEKEATARYSSARELIAALQVLCDSGASSREILASYSSGQHGAVPPHPRSLAVLPFLNLSPDASRDYFVDGLTEALISAAARLGGVRVISRTSSMCYKNTSKSLPLIAQELNVETILEGSVLLAGERVRISCRLIDPRTETHLWSESFDRNLHDMLSLHDDLTQAVGSRLQARIQEHPEDSALSARKINPEAYDEYLRGRFYWNKRNELNLKKAIECFQRALYVDPLYAPAYSGIADSYFYLGYSFGRMDPKDAMPKAQAAALRALELDPYLAEAHCSMALIEAMYDWDWVAAESSFKRAIALNPSLSTAHHLYSLLLSAFRRTEESLAHIHTALERDPLSLPINNFVGMMYFAARRYDPAIAAQRKTIEMDPEFGLAHSVLGAALERKGMNEEAAHEYCTALTVGHHDPEECDLIRKAFEKKGMTGLHERDLECCLERWDGWHGLAFDIGALNACLGRVTEALDWLERACEARSGRIIWFNSGTPFSRAAQYFDNLRDQPRFQRILASVHLPV
jgi:serine/threonine protein kinase